MMLASMFRALISKSPLLVSSTISFVDTFEHEEMQWFKVQMQYFSKI